jgi:hypothetical protein
MALAGLFKLTSPDWKVNLRKPFWSDGGRFSRYKPEFIIAIFNQVLLLAAVFMTFQVARRLFDATAARLSALLMIGSDLFWQFSVSGLPLLLLLVIFLGLIWCLVSFEAAGAAETPDERRRLRLAVVAGLLAGAGMLTQYAFGWIILPLVLFFAFFGGARRTDFALSAVFAFAVTVSPWIARNLAVSGTVLGTAGYAVTENTMMFPDARLMQSLNPDLSGVFGLRPYFVKTLVTLRPLTQNELPKIGGSLVGCLFLAGFLLGLRNETARRLRHFTLACLGLFLLVTAMAQTSLDTLGGGVNGENLLVLLAPLAIIFGVAFFLTLLDQMILPWLPLRYLAMGMMAAVACLPLILTLLPPRARVVSYPPYYPPDLQRIGAWMDPKDLTMSDIPWAVAWYGRRQCVWTTLNSGSEFYQLNDYLKPVNGLYLSSQTMDGRLMSDCLQGDQNNWNAFVLDHIGVRNFKTDEGDDAWDAFFRKGSAGRQKSFPLQYSPPRILTSGVFLTDHPRW